MNAMIEQIQRANPVLGKKLQTLPPSITSQFEEENGTTKLLDELPKTFIPPTAEAPYLGDTVWMLCCAFYFACGRWHEALALSHAFYDHLLTYQLGCGKRVHKGDPLFVIARCHQTLAQNAI